MKTLSHFFPRTISAVVACVLSFGASHLNAATGSDLLAESMKASDVNKSAVSCGSLRSAVNKAVAAHPKQADEIVGAAVAKTTDSKCEKEILENAILALGDYRKYDKKLIPRMVASAIKNGSMKDSGCHSSGVLTKAAILALGKDPSETLVDYIVSAASAVVDPNCVVEVVAAATEAAPQYASSIADAGANASNGGESSGVADVSVFNPTGALNAPGAFFSHSAPNGGLVSATTPVN